MDKIMNDNPCLKRFIYFTGVDRVGKSTTRKAYAMATGEGDITFDRSPVDNLVYDTIFRQAHYPKRNIEEYMLRLRQEFETYIVYLGLDFKEVNKRYKRTEGGTYDLEELRLVSALFKKLLKVASKCGVNVIYIDCNGKSVDEIVKETKRRILKWNPGNKKR